EAAPKGPMERPDDLRRGSYAREEAGLQSPEAGRDLGGCGPEGVRGVPDPPARLERGGPPRRTTLVFTSQLFLAARLALRLALVQVQRHRLLGTQSLDRGNLLRGVLEVGIGRDPLVVCALQFVEQRRRRAFALERGRADAIPGQGTFARALTDVFGADGRRQLQVG